MKRIAGYITAALLVFCAVSAHAEDGGRSVYVANSSFSEYLSSWVYEGDGVSASGWGLTNTKEDIKLSLWLENAEYASAHKTLYSLAPGKYEISAYVRGGGQGNAYMYAKSGGNIVKNTEYSGDFAKKTVSLDVGSDGRLEIGFAAENGTQLWYDADEVSVVCTEEHADESGVFADGSFENGLGGFNVNGGAVISENGRTGNGLYVPSAAAASVKIENIEPGFYEVYMYCKSNNADSRITVSDGRYTAGAVIPCADDWKKVTVTGVYTDNGALDISIESGGELYVDEVCVNKTDKYRSFITGGDITQAHYMEDMGAKYYDAEGNEGDCVKILADSGMDTARVRVYNRTGKQTMTDKGYGSYYLPDGYQDKEDALRQCCRAKENGMNIEFTFHYSDFWTNGEAQEIPMEWRELIAGETEEDKIVSLLEKAVYDYTFDIMTSLKKQGTLPELVSVGNEIQYGMLYPYGYVGENGTNWENLARFLNAGYRAVKEVSPTSRVILHLDGCGDFAKYEEFFGQCGKNNVNYDIIGASYYPFWSRTDIEHAAEFCSSVTERFDKDIIIMETGYNFCPTRPDGYPGQLADNGAYEGIYPSTPEGHKRFMADLFNGLKSVKRCIGDLYWDPVMINCKGAGWAVKKAENDGDKDRTEDNVVANTALFDFNGHVLPTMSVYADTKGADYCLDVCCDSVKDRFDAVEQNGRVKITNNSDKAENIVVYNAMYNEGAIKNVEINGFELKSGENTSFENGQYTFVWTKSDIQPITRRNYSGNK